MNKVKKHTKNQGILAYGNHPTLVYPDRRPGPEAGASLVAPSSWSHSCLRETDGDRDTIKRMRPVDIQLN
jgi:hypothetical protein